MLLIKVNLVQSYIKSSRNAKSAVLWEKFLRLCATANSGRRVANCDSGTQVSEIERSRGSIVGVCLELLFSLQDNSLSET